MSEPAAKRWRQQSQGTHAALSDPHNPLTTTAPAAASSQPVQVVLYPKSSATYQATVASLSSSGRSHTVFRSDHHHHHRFSEHSPSSALAPPPPPPPPTATTEHGQHHNLVPPSSTAAGLGDHSLTPPPQSSTIAATGHFHPADVPVATAAYEALHEHPGSNEHSTVGDHHDAHHHNHHQHHHHSLHSLAAADLPPPPLLASTNKQRKKLVSMEHECKLQVIDALEQKTKSQSQLARELGVSQPTIARWWRDRHNLRQRFMMSGRKRLVRDTYPTINNFVISYLRLHGIARSYPSQADETESLGFDTLIASLLPMADQMHNLNLPAAPRLSESFAASLAPSAASAAQAAASGQHDFSFAAGGQPDDEYLMVSLAARTAIDAVQSDFAASDLGTIGTTTMLHAEQLAAHQQEPRRQQRQQEREGETSASTGRHPSLLTPASSPPSTRHAGPASDEQAGIPPPADLTAVQQRLDLLSNAMHQPPAFQSSLAPGAGGAGQTGAHRSKRGRVPWALLRKLAQTFADSLAAQGQRQYQTFKASHGWLQSLLQRYGYAAPAASRYDERSAHFGSGVDHHLLGHDNAGGEHFQHPAAGSGGVRGHEVGKGGDHEGSLSISARMLMAAALEQQHRDAEPMNGATAFGNAEVEPAGASHGAGATAFASKFGAAGALQDEPVDDDDPDLPPATAQLAD